MVLQKEVLPGTREGNKVTLPAEVLMELLEKDNEFLDKVQMFQLTVFGKVRYVGVQEYTAAPGTIEVPQWIYEDLTKSLDFDPAVAGVPLEIKTALLKKGTLAKLQPVDEESAGALVKLEDQEATLTSTLLNTFSILTKGDSLIVPLPDGGHATVLIVELKTGKEPQVDADTVCLIDTDLEVEIIQSVEYDKEAKRLREKEEMEARLKAEQEEADRIQKEKEEAELAKKAAAQATKDQTAAERERLKVHLAGLSGFNPEPAKGDGVTTVVVQGLGKRLKRNFAETSKVELVLDWIISEAPPDMPMKNFKLHSSYPKKTWDVVADPSLKTQTLKEAGLTKMAVTVEDPDRLLESL